MSDDLGDRMKLYESAEAGRRFMPLLPIIARIDGRCFSGFTRGMDRPYDRGMSNLMIETTRWLVKETNACMGYTQSDEITLAWYSDSIKSQVFFDGRIQKMVSQLAALTTAKFNQLLPDFLPACYASKMPTFDARAWQVPSVDEGANVFLWREVDATKNSVTMAASAHYSHSELHGKGSSDKQEMLFAKGVNWNDYPASFKRGTYIQRRVVKRAFTSEELDKLPPKHEARSNPWLEIERTEYQTVEMPPFGKVLNRPYVVFFGEHPMVLETPALLESKP